MSARPRRSGPVLSAVCEADVRIGGASSSGPGDGADDRAERQVGQEWCVARPAPAVQRTQRLLR